LYEQSSLFTVLEIKVTFYSMQAEHQEHWVCFSRCPTGLQRLEISVMDFNC